MKAIGHRIIEMRDQLIHPELRMESQLQEMCSQIQKMGADFKNIQPQTENFIPTNLIQDTNDPPSKPPTKNVTLKSRDKSTTLIDISTSKLLPRSTNKDPPEEYIPQP